MTGWTSVERQMASVDRGLIFTNLVDFDTQYGHRNDVAGYAANLERFDARLAGAAAAAARRRSARSSPPTTATIRRRRAPITRASTCRCSSTGARVRAGVDLGTRTTFADLGQTLAEVFGVGRSRTARASCGDHRDDVGLGTAAMTTSAKQLEARERDILAPQAAKSADSRGRLRPEPEDDVRPAFQRDRDRIIHCKAFRRLKHKTQVFFAPTGDHYRTRLTHTLEVSQIARTHRQGAAAARGADRGDRARPRSRAHAVRPRRRARHRRADARRLQPLRAEPAHRRRARERRPGPEPDVGSARRHREALERASRARRSACRRAARRARSKGRSCASRISSPTSTTTSTTRRARGCCAPRICRRTWSACSATSSSVRIGTLVKDVVTETLAGGLTEIRMSERRAERGPRACARFCSKRSTRTPSPH